MGGGLFSLAINVGSFNTASFIRLTGTSSHPMPKRTSVVTADYSEIFTTSKLLVSLKKTNNTGSYSLLRVKKLAFQRWHHLHNGGYFLLFMFCPVPSSASITCWLACVTTHCLDGPSNSLLFTAGPKHSVANNQVISMQCGNLPIDTNCAC